MGKDSGIFMKHGASFSNTDSDQFISSNLYQRVVYPKEYPAIILVHQEHPAHSVPLHWHPGPELIYPRNRELTVTVDGVKQIIRPGEFALISSYALHSVVPAYDSVRQDVLGITFHAIKLEQISPQLTKRSISRNAPNATDASRRQMIELCEQLRQHVENVNKEETHSLKINRILFSMLELIYSNFLLPEKQVSHKSPELLNKLIHVLDYIDKHYQENLSTQLIAEQFGYSREYFCRLFKRYANQTFKQYLLDIRMNAVIAEMKVSNRSIGQIALNNGFPNEKALFLEFKKKYNMTPMQYRKTSVKNCEI